NWSNGGPEPENPLAAIWLGDFNMEPGSAEYRRIVGSTPYHRGAVYRDGFVDAAAAASEPVADFHTHEKIIDGGLSMLATRVHSIGADIGEAASDHFPVRVDIDLETPGLAATSGGG
ncbi:MAG: EEP domain-containing protein, partial [Mesorhizobium sp.]